MIGTEGLQYWLVSLIAECWLATEGTTLLGSEGDEVAGRDARSAKLFAFYQSSLTHLGTEKEMGILEACI